MEHKDYQKINTIYKRDQDGRLIFGDWSLPEFEFLKDCKFRAEEKIDGTNIHVRFNGVRVEFGGRTDKANIPPHLLTKLEELFTIFNVMVSLLYKKIKRFKWLNDLFL